MILKKDSSIESKGLLKLSNPQQLKQEKTVFIPLPGQIFKFTVIQNRVPEINL